MTVFVNPDVLPTFSERRSARTGSEPSPTEDSSATEHTTSPESGVKLGKEVENLLPAATKLRQGNVLTRVCDSVHRGVSASVQTPGKRQTPPKVRPPRSDTPLGQTPPPRSDPPGQTPPKRQTPPRSDTPRSDTLQGQTPKVRHPPRSDTPQVRHPPRSDTPPRGRHLPGQTPPGQIPPRSDNPKRQTPPKNKYTPRNKYIPQRISTPPKNKYTPHTVNKRPVRILLECILVTDKFCLGIVNNWLV